MYVVATALHADDLAVLTSACAELSLALHDTDPETTNPDYRDVLLAGICAFGTVAEPTPSGIKARGAYPIAVLPSVSGTEVLAALAEGFSFVLARPLGRPRLLDCLGYLKSVVPPQTAQVLTITPGGTLASSTASVDVSDAEAGMLRCLARSPGQIVGGHQLTAAVGGADANLIASVLKQKLEDIDSGARILKLPHLGFRLMGTVREADRAGMIESA